MTAFSGRAVYDSGVWDGIAEDVSDFISMISPSQTPLLAHLGDAPYPAYNVLHEWLEDELVPDTLTSSGTMINSTSQLSVAVHSRGTSVGNYLCVGTHLKCDNTGEYMRVTATSGGTITVARAQCGTTIATVMAGYTFTLLGATALEGASVSDDVSRPRSRKTNYCEIMKKDIIVSGTEQAVTHIGVADEFDRQRTLRQKEVLRDLEKTVILGKLTGNTIGSSTNYRTMKGIWDFISTNSTSVATLTADGLNDSMRAAYVYGARDLDLIVADPVWKQLIDNFTSSRVRQTNDDNRYVSLVTEFQSSFGDLPVITSQWMPARSAMVLSTERVNVLPLKGRSFQFEPVSRTGDAVRGMVLGEYTCEVRNEEGLAKIYG